MKVSALIPTYNRRTHVFRAIQSVLAQTVPVDEIIVVDDGSIDGTAEAIRSQYGSRVSVFSQENKGVSAARKRAVEAARGEWVAFLDSDDEWLPDRNAAFLKAASRVPENVALIFGDTQLFTDEGEGHTVFGQNGLLIDHDLCIFNNPLSLLASHISSNSVWAYALQSSFIRRSVLVEFECFREGLNHSEDFLAIFQVASRYMFAAIPLVVTKLYRTSDLRQSSLEFNQRSGPDVYKARIISYSLAARTASVKPWGNLHAESVRALCKWRARNGMPIRRLALDQFVFGVSPKSIIFLCGAMIGPGFFRAGFVLKRKLNALLHSD
jgi:glycosyltransferase involved in cell wall biosynthesis